MRGKTRPVRPAVAPGAPHEEAGAIHTQWPRVISLQRIHNFPLHGRGTPALRQGHNAPCLPGAHRSDTRHKTKLHGLSEQRFLFSLSRSPHPGHIYPHSHPHPYPYTTCAHIVSHPITSSSTPLPTYCVVLVGHGGPCEDLAELGNRLLELER